MRPKVKRLYFGILFALFAIFTILVDTIGTAQDNGAPWMNEKAQNGKLLFQEKNCTACHQIYGLGGYMGPDLTNVISYPGKGPEYAKAFLAAGTQRMPNFHLTAIQIEELVAFLTYVDKTGISPVRKFKINSDGTVTATARTK